MTYVGTKSLKMTSSPWTLPAVPNYYTSLSKLLLKSNVRKQKSTIKNGGKCSNRKKSKFKSWTNFLSDKKPVESQYSSSSPKNLIEIKIHLYKRLAVQNKQNKEGWWNLVTFVHAYSKTGIVDNCYGYFQTWSVQIVKNPRNYTRTNWTCATKWSID